MRGAFPPREPACNDPLGHKDTEEMGIADLSLQVNKDVLSLHISTYVYRSRDLFGHMRADMDVEIYMRVRIFGCFS